MILNWKSDEVRMVKKLRPEKISPFEIPIKFEIEAEIPEQPVHQIKGKIEVPKQKVKEIMFESL